MVWGGRVQAGGFRHGVGDRVGQRGLAGIGVHGLVPVVQAPLRAEIVQVGIVGQRLPMRPGPVHATTRRSRCCTCVTDAGGAAGAGAADSGCATAGTVNAAARIAVPVASVPARTNAVVSRS